MPGLSRPEIYSVVNNYIGVKDGYLGDFSYRSHIDFYPQFCDLDINPSILPGTTRSRFINILESSTPDVQARILAGVLKKYDIGSSELRTPARHAEIQAMIARLSGARVSSPAPRTTSAVVERAIIDAETLLNTSGATSGVDRIHTALHGYLLLKCEDAGIPHGDEPSLTDLYKQLRAHHPNLKREAAHGVLIDRILKGLAAILDSLNTLRNRASVAHPNAALLDHEEALLAINTARTALHYLASKLD